MTASTVEEVAAVTPADTPAERRRIRAQAREERYQKRLALFNADPNMDPRRRDLYLDRTLLSMAEVAAALGLSGKQRIYAGRRGARPHDGGETHTPPHPSAFVEIDAWDSEGMKVERGRLYEWAEKARQYVLDLDTGTLIKGRNRHGRRRRDRTTMSTVHVPGTPRRVRQRRLDPDQ
jgi:hypothetical protein